VHPPRLAAGRPLALPRLSRAFRHAHTHTHTAALAQGTDLPPAPRRAAASTALPPPPGDAGGGGSDAAAGRTEQADLLWLAHANKITFERPSKDGLPTTMTMHGVAPM